MNQDITKFMELLKTDEALQGKLKAEADNYKGDQYSWRDKDCRSAGSYQRYGISLLHHCGNECVDFRYDSAFAEAAAA